MGDKILAADSSQKMGYRFGELGKYSKFQKTGIGQRKYCQCSHTFQSHEKAKIKGQAGQCAKCPCSAYKPSKSASLRAKKGIRKVSVKGKNEQTLLKRIKELVVQEYHEALGGYKSDYMEMDLDHIHGRHGGNFPLTAMFDMRNLQLLDRMTHSQSKTNGLTKEEQRKDHRDKRVEARLIAVAERITKRLGPAWTIPELKKAVEWEIYQK